MHTLSPGFSLLYFKGLDLKGGYYLPSGLMLKLSLLSFDGVSFPVRYR